MEFTALQIAGFINGKVDGDPEVRVFKLSKIEDGSKGSISFLANPKYTQYLYSTDASVVIVSDELVLDQPVGSTLVRVADPYSAFASLLEMYNKIKLNRSGIAESAWISGSASIGENVYIGEMAYIGDNAVVGDNVKVYPHSFVGDNVTIGRGSILFAGVKVYSDNVIGSDCVIHAGVVIGADGFGFAKQDNSDYKKVSQIGNVIIEDDVEIGANTTIDRATLGSTILRRGVKLDNLIQVAHNVEIGENTVIAAQTGISGSAKIGRNCMIGGQVGIVGHITIADNVKIAAQAGVASSIRQEGAVVMGAPAMEVAKFKKAFVYFKNLPDLIPRLLRLEKLSSQPEDQEM